jgi:hypothetical protein
MRWTVGLLLLASATAHGDSIGVADHARPPGLAPPAPPDVPVAPMERVAIAVNEPAGWTQLTFGLSAYTAITPHQALRANFTTHQPENAFDIGIGTVLSGGEDDGTHAGSIRDFSVGWMWFPRRVYDGPSIEFDALLRLRHQVDMTDEDDTITTNATTIGARATVGWSWRFYKRFFISAAFGGSAGHRHGTVTTDMTSVMPLPDTETALEGFVRFGVLAGPSAD